MIESFFSHLGQRLRKENHLSDVTWALCNCSENFRNLFLNFFFEDAIDYSKPIFITREVGFNDSRPDFRILHGDDEYIIENKIYDRNLQFEKYSRDFPNAKAFGYISNYTIKPVNGNSVKTWTQFKEYVLKFMASHEGNLISAERQLILGYVKYITNICSIIKIQKMNLDGLSSLHHFNILLGQLLRESYDGFELNEWNQTKSYESYKSGRSFRLRKSGDRITPVYGWIGIYYFEKEENVGIYISFNTNGGGTLYKKLKSSTWKAGQYFDTPYDEDNEFWFMLKPKLFSLFK